MSNEEFDKLVDERIEKILATLKSKGQEYATDTDRLHNFNKAARMSGQTREQALWGMALKHRVSVDDIVEATAKGRFPNNATISEKITDYINYLILLEACLTDKLKTDLARRVGEATIV